MESATITIDTAFPGATQDVMQGFVTTPIAQAIATASGIEYITSKSLQGSSRISAKLVLNADADRAMKEILAQVQQVKFRLPTGVTDTVKIGRAVCRERRGQYGKLAVGAVSV